MRRRPFGSDPVANRDRRKIATRPRIEAMEERRLLTTLFVTNTNDNGAGSLRQAILDANGSTGSDVIDFNISGSGIHTITLTSGALPSITDTVLIDGTSQPTNGGPTLTTPLVQVDGSALTTGTTDGLTINLVTGSIPATIRGLAISGFTGSGVVISGVGGNAVQGNLIGTNPVGTAAAANGVGVSILGSTNNTVGGVVSTFRNVISGNTGAGVAITGAASTGNVVEGDLIGTDVSGATAIPNANGVVIASGADNNTVGGAVAAARDVISGNTGAGVLITGAGTTGNVVQGDYIGLSSSGTTALGNAEGVVLSESTSSNSVGGPAISTRNVISGNTVDNVHVVGATNDLIAGNLIGLNSDGSAALAGTQGTSAGVVLEDGAIGNTVGGAASTAGNIIGGTAGPGIQIRGRSSSTVGTAAGGNQIAGNFVGTNLAGTAAVPNLGGGIVLSDGTANNTVGGAAGGGARNIVSGNTGEGISLRGASTTGNAIQANLIGVQVDGTTALANSGDGILIDGASNNTVGGSVAAASNTIADSGQSGVFINSGTGNTVRHNSIFTNAGLGIDLAPRGVNPNIATQPGVGPNDLQNYPVLTGVSTTGGVSTVTGNFISAPNTTYTLDFYSRNATDPSGIGQGRTFAGTTTVTTDANGFAAVSAPTTTVIPSGGVVTATATDPGGNTSEFSNDIVNATATVDLSVALVAVPTTAAVGGQITYALTVANFGASDAPGVVLTNTLPTGVTFLGATASTGSVSQSTTSVTATLGTLAAGAQATMMITVVTTQAGSLTDTATATSAGTEVNQGNNTATVTTTVAQGVDLSVTSTSSPSPATVGSPVAVTFTVTNNSTANSATVVNLTAPLPAGATVVSSSSTQGSSLASNGTLQAAFGTLGAGASASVTVVLNPTTTGTLATTATVTATQPEVNPTTNATTSVVTVNAASSTPAGTDGPRVLAVDRSGYHSYPSRVAITFSGALQSSTATDTANYQILMPGRDGKFGTKDDVSLKLASAFYDPTTNLVTLRTRKPFSLHKTVVLTINGTSSTGVRGTGGELLDGTNSGEPGSDFVQAFHGVGPGRLALFSFQAKRHRSTKA